MFWYPVFRADWAVTACRNVSIPRYYFPIFIRFHGEHITPPKSWIDPLTTKGFSKLEVHWSSTYLPTIASNHDQGTGVARPNKYLPTYDCKQPWSGYRYARPNTITVFISNVEKKLLACIQEGWLQADNKIVLRCTTFNHKLRIYGVLWLITVDPTFRNKTVILLI